MSETYASAYQLVAETLQAFLPARKLTVAEVAAEHRYLTNEGGGYVGRWDHSIAPYLVEPMECLTSPTALTVAIVGPGQCGKTEIAQNWLLWCVKVSPADLLWYMQTDPGIKAFVKNRINPMIESHAALREALGTAAEDDSLGYKKFRGMKVELLGASRSNMINKSAPRIYADEYDNYPEALGNPKGMLDVRRQTYGNDSMLAVSSHCDRAKGLDPSEWKAGSGIMAIFADSDMRLWWAPCPDCGAWSCTAPIAPRVYTLEYPADGTLEEVEAGAYLRCPVNGCVLEEPSRKAMMRGGRWVAKGQEIDQDGLVTGTAATGDTIGFWILGIMSPFLLRGIGGLARELVKAQRKYEATGDETDLREVMVKQIGAPYAPPKHVGSVDAETLAERARGETMTPLGVVPPFVRFLTVAVDCQIAHFEWLVRGWGVGGESAVIATGRLPADPATSAEDWDALLEQVLVKAWPLGDGRAMRPRGAGFDLNGPPGTTQQAYSAWRRWRTRPHTVRNYGTIGGREAWSILPLQGANVVRAQRLTVVYPDTTRKAGKFAKGEVPVARFNPNGFKDDLAGQLQKAEAGPLYVHCPAALRSTASPHRWFEQLVSETRSPLGEWKKPHSGTRNEALDLMVMAHVVADLHGLSRLQWQSPPPWAAPWDTNSMISQVAGGVSAGTPAATLPALSAGAAPAGAAPAPASARSVPPSTPAAAVVASKGNSRLRQLIRGLR